MAYYGQNKEGGKFQISQVCVDSESKRLTGVGMTTRVRLVCVSPHPPAPARVGDILLGVGLLGLLQKRTKTGSFPAAEPTAIDLREAHSVGAGCALSLSLS